MDAADFNDDDKPDYLFFNATTRQSAIWYLNNSVLVSGAYRPTVATVVDCVLPGFKNTGCTPGAS